MKPPLTIPTCVKEFCRLNRERFLPGASDAKFDDLMVGQIMLVLDLISEKQGRLQGSIARLSSIHKHSKTLDNASFKSLVAYLSEAGLVDASASDYVIARASDLRGSDLPLSVWSRTVACSAEFLNCSLIQFESTQSLR